MTDAPDQPAVDNYGTRLNQDDRVAVTFTDFVSSNTPHVVHLLGVVTAVQGGNITVRIPEGPAVMGWHDGDEIDAVVQGDFTYRLEALRATTGLLHDDDFEHGDPLTVLALAGEPTC